MMVLDINRGYTMAYSKLVHTYMKRDKPMPPIIKIILAMGRSEADKRYGTGSYDWAKDGVKKKSKVPIIRQHHHIP